MNNGIASRRRFQVLSRSAVRAGLTGTDSEHTVDVTKLVDGRVAFQCSCKGFEFKKTCFHILRVTGKLQKFEPEFYDLSATAQDLVHTIATSGALALPLVFESPSVLTNDQPVLTDDGFDASAYLKTLLA